MPSETPTPYRIALRSTPYALPFAVGLVCLTWGLTELVSLFTDAYWVLWQLLPGLAVLGLGCGFVLFGAVGALARVGVAGART